MPSGSITTMTNATTAMPAPPGIFVASMPPELSTSASPVPSSEDRESVSSNESRRRRRNAGLSNGNTIGSTNESAPALRFVLNTPKPPNLNKLRRKARSHRIRHAQSSSGSYPPNMGLKVTIRRTVGDSHTLETARTEGGQMSPSSVYSSVPGDDEKSPMAHVGLGEGFRRNSSPHPMSNMKVEDHPTSKSVGTSTTDISTMTEPHLLGLCPPGTRVTLDADVWLDMDNMLVVNVEWRGRSFVGTFMESTKNSLTPACPEGVTSVLSQTKLRQRWKLYEPSSSRNSAVANSGIPPGSVQTRSSKSGSEDARRRPVAGRGRRRRRGGLTSVASTSSLASQGMESNHEDQVGVSATPESQSKLPDLICPHPGCGFRFASMTGVRLHMDFCAARNCSNKPPQDITNHLLKSDEVVKKSDPPKLAEAPVVVEVHSDSCGEEAMDEDPPPPELDRGPPAVDETVEPSRPMPKASPAYSDISDDGPGSPLRGGTRPTLVDAVSQPQWVPPQSTTISVTQQPQDWSTRRSLYDYAPAPSQLLSPTFHPQNTNPYLRDGGVVRHPFSLPTSISPDMIPAAMYPPSTSGGASGGHLGFPRHQQQPAPPGQSATPGRQGMQLHQPSYRQ